MCFVMVVMVVVLAMVEVLGEVVVVVVVVAVNLPYGLGQGFGGVLRDKHVAGKPLVCRVLGDEAKIPAENTTVQSDRSARSSVQPGGFS